MIPGTRDGEAFAQFDDDMCKPARGRPLPDIDNPFSEHRGIDQRVAPEHLGDVRISARHGPQRSVTDKAKLGRDQADEIVVHAVQI